MSTRKIGHVDAFNVLSEDAWLELVDKQAQHYVGMNAREFIAAWKTGKFAPMADRPDVMRIAMLLPPEVLRS